jgi:hypothetical protein
MFVKLILIAAPGTGRKGAIIPHGHHIIKQTPILKKKYEKSVPCHPLVGKKE